MIKAYSYLSLFHSALFLVAGISAKGYRTIAFIATISIALCLLWGVWLLFFGSSNEDNKSIVWKLCIYLVLDVVWLLFFFTHFL